MAAAPPPTYSPIGRARVLGQNAAGRVSLFGPADADVREGSGRKLQFAGPICVLDAYLYPPQQGAGAERVTYVDARTAAGTPTDGTQCALSLSRP